MYRLENLLRKKYSLMYNYGSAIVVGTSVKLPDYISYANIYSYYFKVRVKGGASYYFSLDSSANGNTVDYTLFNGIKFQLDLNSNILKLVANPNSELISMDVFNNLTQF